MLTRNEPLALLPVYFGPLDGEERAHDPSGWLVAKSAETEYVYVLAQDCDGTRFWTLYEVRGRDRR